MNTFVGYHFFGKLAFAANAWWQWHFAALAPKVTEFAIPCAAGKKWAF
jgi:hypothetical protein